MRDDIQQLGVIVVDIDSLSIDAHWVANRIDANRPALARRVLRRDHERFILDEIIELGLCEELLQHGFQRHPGGVERESHLVVYGRLGRRVGMDWDRERVANPIEHFRKFSVMEVGGCGGLERGADRIVVRLGSRESLAEIGSHRVGFDIARFPQRGNQTSDALRAAILVNGERPRNGLQS